MNRQILTPRAVTRREQEAQERRDNQRVAMNAERVETDYRTFNQSVAASNDHYMTSALEKVRQSNVTHSDEITRISGTWLHNKRIDSLR